MDAKITMSFDAGVIEKAKQYADSHGISLSRLTEILLRKATFGGYQEIEDIPIARWVQQVSEGEAEYISTPRKRKNMKEEYYKSKK